MLLLTLALLASSPPQDAGLAGDAGVAPPLSVVAELQRIAKKLEPEAKAPWVKRWLGGVKAFTPVKPQTWFCTKDRQSCVPQKPNDPAYAERIADEEYVYARIADPLGYFRAYEVLAAAGFDPTGKKVVDFGYGNVAVLNMLAQLGVDVHGIEIDTLLPQVSQHLVGKVGKSGHVTLHQGFFPTDPKLVKELGTGYDLWLSKNTLKRGYVHPAEPAGAKAELDLGPDDAVVLGHVFNELKPGGLFFIFNIGPAMPATYKNMADIRCPYSKEALTAAGFEILAYDVDDGPLMRAAGHTMEWDSDGTDLNTSYFASYSLFRKPKK